MNRTVKLMVALAIASVAIVAGSIGSTFLGSDTGSQNNRITSHDTTLTQTAIILSTEMISSITTETTSTTAVVTSTSIISSNQATSQTKTSSTNFATSAATSTTTVASIASITYTTTDSQSSATSLSSTISTNSTIYSSSTISSTSTTTSTTTTSVLTTSTTSSTSSTDSTTSTTFLSITMSVTCSPSLLQLGSSAVCSATVTDATPHSTTTPTGKVTFASKLDGSFTPSSCTLSGSGPSATCSVAFSPGPLGVGSNTITTIYAGDSLHSGGSGTFDLVIAQAATIVACTPNTATITTQTSCVATEINSGGLPIPTGTFIFTSDKSGAFDHPSCNLDPLGSCMMSYTPSAGSEGVTTITVTYGGDQRHSSNSGTTKLTVTQISTGVQINCNPNSVTVNQTVSCDASVQDSTPGVNVDPSGTVAVFSNFVSTSCVLNGQKCTVTFTPGGSASGQNELVTARYDGDADHSTSSGNTTISVSLRQSSIDLKCNPDNVLVNQPTLCTATVNDNGPGPSSTPTGAVTITTDFTSLSCNLPKSNTASVSCSVTLTPGTGSTISQHVVTAIYSGDAMHSSSSHSTNLNVNQRSVSSSLSCNPNPVIHNSPTVCTVTVIDTGGAGSPVTPTGTVSFQSNSGGTFSSSSCTLKPMGTPGESNCSVTFTPNSAGNYDMNANYSGDTDHQQNKATTKLNVN